MNEFCYAVNEDDTFEECPEEVALDRFNYDGQDGDIVQVYQGESYKPTLQDEIDWMDGEGYKFLVKNVKPYAKYKYIEETDSVEQVKDDE